ncbi:MAG TPA: short-chain dehydrogenase, partial [Acidimicrobiaceae bacterium]|nr:short-chain dehydrogenase [Acidimicrobiaceae bacterium]
MADGALRGYGVLVTGGSTGIGRACAEALAADGAVVTICGRTESSLTDAVDAIRPGHGGSVHHVVADVTSEDDVRTAVAATVANAG